ncbi:hypothetical protein HG537_0H00120 [Torulaspora globosa]|uniref:Uncharacterized protein n=1 Tax=Torulaspora globosa TaxID=48254 RepID=A0A7H9HXX7_9SACH|nr:hypothetical protein HG537_0C06580 [Torulaspora sp. CBS 2947]QLQ82251.1 hypothetical protein HG537_0H00120 [Torulaspora sp. CBS 2947]
MAEEDNSNYVLYYYVPNKGAAIFFTIAFILSTCLYAYQVYAAAKRASKQLRSKRDEFDLTKEPVMVRTGGDVDKKLEIGSIVCCFIPFFIGCVMEAIGYIARAVSSSDKEALTPFIIQTVLLLVAPALYAATIYMVFGRLLRILRCENLMLVSSRFGTAFFVSGDVLSFLLQASGGGLMASAGNTQLGANLVTAGLVVQIVFFGFFIINEMKFSIGVSQSCPFYWQISKNWFYVNLTFLVSSVLIMVRSIVRLIEFIQGHDGFIISHEVFIYVFDAVPMLLVAVTFCVGSYLGNIFRVLAEARGFDRI